jgi:signal transduction histidine kinase
MTAPPQIKSSDGRVTGVVMVFRDVTDVMDALETCGPLFAQKRHTLSVEVPRTGLLVFGDATRLGQIVSNLLTNAAKYTPPDGKVTILATREHDFVVVRIRDTGIGIAPDALGRVWSRPTAAVSRRTATGWVQAASSCSGCP